MELPLRREGRQFVFRHKRLFRLGRDTEVQGTVQVHAFPFQRQGGMPGLRRKPSAQGGFVGQGLRQDDRRGAVNECGRGTGLLHGPLPGSLRAEHRGRAPVGNRLEAALRAGCGAFLSYARPCMQHALGRREPEGQPRDGARLEPRGFDVHTRRAEHRTASARYRKADRRAEASARHRKHRHSGRTRRGDDARRRPADRYGPPCRKRGRRGGVRGSSRRRCGPLGPSAVPDAAVSGRPPCPLYPLRPPLDLFDNGQGSHGAQPQGYRCQLPSRDPDRSDGSLRFRQVLSCRRHTVSGTVQACQRGRRPSRHLPRPCGQPRPYHAGRICRPEPDRAQFPFQRADLSEDIRRCAQAVRQAAVRQDERFHGGVFLVQFRRGTLSGVPGRRRRPHQHAVHGRCRNGLRVLLGKAFQAGGARGQVPREEHLRHIPDVRRRGGGLLFRRQRGRGRGNRIETQRAAGCGAGLHKARTEQFHAFRRREPAHKARIFPVADAQGRQTGENNVYI